MNNLTFTGVDASLEVSLLEYGLLVSNEEHEDGSGTHFVIYKYSDEDGYSTCHISEREVNDLISGNEWPTKDGIAGILSYCGMSKEEFINDSLVNKLLTVIQYWGTLNIFGVPSFVMSEEEVKERYLK